MPRVNIKISDELKEYFEQKSLDSGASQSSLMALYLAEYVDQKKAMESMVELSQILKSNPNFFDKRD
ncbi:MAG: hypothetical protein RR533_10160 [Carnobacterium sp.]